MRQAVGGGRGRQVDPVAVEGDVDPGDAQQGEAVAVLGARVGAVVAIDGAGAPRAGCAGARWRFRLPPGLAVGGAGRKAAGSAGSGALAVRAATPELSMCVAHGSADGGVGDAGGAKQAVTARWCM